LEIQTRDRRKRGKPQRRAPGKPEEARLTSCFRESGDLLVSRGGVSLLTETARVGWLEPQLLRALEPWARRGVVYDPGRVVRSQRALHQDRIDAVPVRANHHPR